MIYLIAQIFVYMLVSLGVGVIAGWLWRDLQASAREGAVERTLLDARGRLPQMEAALRDRDQRLQALHAELEARSLELEGQAERLAARDRAVAELERACEELRSRLESSTPAAAPAESADELAAVRDELARTQRALAAEQRRVEELGQERELQRRSLQALEQQLDLAREDRQGPPRAAAG